MTTSEPPSPAETVAPNDPWTVRTALVIVGLALLTLIVGGMVLAYVEKDMPDEYKMLASALGGALVTMLTLRAAPSDPPRLRRNRDQGSVTLQDIVLVLIGIAVIVWLVLTLR